MAEHDEAGSAVERFRFSTRHEGETEDFIRRTYVGNRTRFEAVRRGARFSANGAVASGIAADRIRSTVDYSAACDPFDYHFFLIMDNGRIRVRDGRTDTLVLAGQSAMYPLDVPLDVQLADFDMRTLRLPRARLVEVARESTGIAAADLRFEDVVPVSAAMARYWSSVLTLANTTLLAEDGPSAHPLLVEELTRTAALAALRTFPNTTMTRQHDPGPEWVGPAALRRALAHIEANAHLPLTLSDIAAAAGVTGRGLQHAFARHHDRAPMAHLRRVRLERAHRDLLAADPTAGATVADIASRWGFRAGGRFAAAYRDAYGQTPGRTLRT